MKFVIAVVVLALAVGVQSSWYPGLYGGHGPAVSYHTIAAHPALPYLAHGPAVSYASHVGGPYLAHGPAAVHVSSVHNIPAAVHVASPWSAHGHEGVYVAKTRGAVHTAPLAGHVHSATSINLAPAPGTV